MATGKGIGGIKGAVASRKAASVAAAAGGPKATSPTAGKPMGVMSNGPAAAKSGMGIKGASRTIMDAYKTGGSKAAGKAMREYAGRTPKKPFGTL
jgi:hypothetical protein